MDVKEFRKLCGSLKALTGPQPKELLLALKSPDMRMRALGAIETRREGPRGCPRCGRGKDGPLGGGAKRGPADAVRGLPADLFLDDGHGGVRDPFAGRLPPGHSGHVFRPSAFVPASRRGARLRQDDHLGPEREINPALEGSGEAGGGRLTHADGKAVGDRKRFAPAGPTPTPPTHHPNPGPPSPGDAVFCNDRDPAYDFFARQTSVPHYRFDAKRPLLSSTRHSTSRRSTVCTTFERFMSRSAGRRRNLPGCASWFIARSVRTEPERVEDAWDRLMDA